MTFFARDSYSDILPTLFGPRSPLRVLRVWCGDRGAPFRGNGSVLWIRPCGRGVATAASAPRLAHKEDLPGVVRALRKIKERRGQVRARARVRTVRALLHAHLGSDTPRRTSVRQPWGSHDRPVEPAVADKAAPSAQVPLEPPQPPS